MKQDANTSTLDACLLMHYVSTTVSMKFKYATVRTLTFYVSTFQKIMLTYSHLSRVVEKATQLVKKFPAS
jgi:hypothetical protein